MIFFAIFEESTVEAVKQSADTTEIGKTSDFETTEGKAH